MPRAGSGGGHSSSHRSSGGHSSSRSSGGHHVSSGSHSRAGSGHSSSYHGSSFRHSAPPPPPLGGPMPPPPPRKYHRRRYTRTYYYGSPSKRLSSSIIIVIVLTVVLIVLPLLFSAISTARPDNSFNYASARSRNKLKSGLSFNSDCIVDELDWFDSVPKAGAKLRTFYDKTGVQPYIVLLKYHPELTTDSQKEDYALEYYDAHIDNESTFLYMYFAEQNQDNDVGYMCYVNGKQVDSVMDAEAIDIFWGYIDRYWYDDMSTDALFEKAFTKTAETIMKK